MNTLRELVYHHKYSCVSMEIRKPNYEIEGEILPWPKWYWERTEQANHPLSLIFGMLTINTRGNKFLNIISDSRPHEALVNTC